MEMEVQEADPQDLQRSKTYAAQAGPVVQVPPPLSSPQRLILNG